MVVGGLHKTSTPLLHYTAGMSDRCGASCQYLADEQENATFHQAAGVCDQGEGQTLMEAGPWSRHTA